MWAQVRLPDPEIFFRAGRLPEDLRRFAVMHATTGIDSTKLPAEDAVPFIHFMYALAAETLRGLAPKGADEPATFTPVAVTGSELREMDIPPEDLAAIIGIANRRQTPYQVTAQSALDLGLQGVFAASRAAAAAAGSGTVAEWGPFRGESGSLDRGPDGAAVRAAAVGNDRPNRSARRLRSRRGVGG